MKKDSLTIQGKTKNWARKYSCEEMKSNIAFAGVVQVRFKIVHAGYIRILWINNVHPKVINVLFSS